MAALANANVEVFLQLLRASMDEGTPFNVAVSFVEEQIKQSQMSPEQKVGVMNQFYATIATQFTIQAMESSRSLALDDLLFALKEKQLQLEVLKAEAQVDLAKAEIEFNKARTELVRSQNASEKEKMLNIVRERYAIDDQLRIKCAEFLSNVNFGYAAGGVKVPQGLQEVMLNSINEILSHATNSEMIRTLQLTPSLEYLPLPALPAPTI